MTDDARGVRRRPALEGDLAGWLTDQVEENPAVLAAERIDGDVPRWFVRMQGEDKDVFTIRFALDQRTLRYESHFMPGPEENHERLFEHLLRRNAGLYGVAFSIGEEDAIYLNGQLAVDALDGDEIDRILGTVYATVEQCFRPALQIGFASRLAASEVSAEAEDEGTGRR